MKITKRLLKRKGATCDQVDIFAKEWPRGCEVTLENVTRAVALGLDIDWAAENLLTAAAWAEYNDKATAASWDEYNKYNKARVAAWDEYVKATAAAAAAAAAVYTKVRANNFVMAANE